MNKQMAIQPSPSDSDTVASSQVKVRPHQGMPPLDESGPPTSFFEFWPMWAFYPPVALYCLWLMLRYRGPLLPTVANPAFPAGGIVGESKADILRIAVKAIPDWVAPFVFIDRPAVGQPTHAAQELAEALRCLRSAGLALPVVAKPDLGCRGAGVKLIRTEVDLLAYIQAFPAGARYLLQRYVPFEGEAGVFYCRLPGQSSGHIVSLTLKYFPHVLGDGKRSLEQLILDDPRAARVPHLYLKRHAQRLHTVPAAGQAIRLAFAGSHSRGAIFRNGTALVTPAMEARFESLARQMPEFHFGRFDIRFNDFGEVQAGGAFTIVEVNGAGAESTHIWDRHCGLLEAWRDLMRQYRALFQIGQANRQRGFKPMTFMAFWRAWRHEKALTALYPPTD